MPFSVLLSVYWKENPLFLSRSLDSVFTQALKPDEVILVEDGVLTPELYSVIDKFQKFHHELKTVKLEKNSGLGVALNEGLKHCTFDIVARMDTDDIAKTDRFEKQIKFLEENTEIDLVGSWVDEFKEDTDNILSIRKIPEKPEEIYEYCKGRCPVNHPTVVFRKNAVLKAGGYLTEYFPEDYFLWIRMLMNGSKFYNLQESLLYFRVSEGTIKRRGGFKYALDEIHIQKMIYKTGFINFPVFIKNSFIRFCVRIFPLKLRTFVYNRMLREKVK